jgi:TPR repeat protein
LISHSFGERYSNGDGVNKDLSEAVKWYRISAAKGNEKAEKTLKELGDNVSSIAQP